MHRQKPKAEGRKPRKSTQDDAVLTGRAPFASKFATEPRSYYAARVKGDKWTKPVLVHWGVLPKFKTFVSTLSDKLNLKKSDQKALRLFVTANGTAIYKDNWNALGEIVAPDRSVICQDLDSVHISVVTDCAATFTASEEESRVTQAHAGSVSERQEPQTTQSRSAHSRLASKTAKGGENVMLLCKSCDGPFLWSVEEQRLFAEMHYREPRRCKPCRAAGAYPETSIHIDSMWEPAPREWYD